MCTLRGSGIKSSGREEAAERTIRPPPHMKPQHMFLLLRAGDVEILKLPGKPDKDKEAPEPRVALENKDGGNI